MTRVKICGLTEVRHIEAAARAGADFIGLVFAPSRRQVPVEKASQLAEAARGVRPSLSVVGVFVNSTADEVNRIADHCRLDWVQLSGDETWQYCKQIERPIIKAIHVSTTGATSDITTEISMGYQLLLYQKLVCLLDSKRGDTYGGTGQTFDWTLAREVVAKFPVIIAGGLNPANVMRLVSKVHPWGVDVSSGVETKGKKDAAKITSFIETVKKVETHAHQSG